jgi:hypothetical protein
MASCADSGSDSGRIRFAANSNARSDVPTQIMYRAIGMGIFRHNIV